MAQQHTRVRVEDALTYLDHVKTQFASEPGVYTQFLDIMKDFKSQSIDTPGVISRVSSLFSRQPSLIVGFNTFLPAGFEVRLQDGQITIAEPDGTIKVVEAMRENEEGHSPKEDKEEQNEEEEEVPEAEMEGEDDEVEEDYDDDEEEGGNEEEEDVEDDNLLHDKTSNEDKGRSALIGRKELNEPMELNYAVEYVNRIKTRFADRPYVYKEFLEILHNYHKSYTDISRGSIEGGIVERSVMRAIGQLFKDETDLLEEFKYFLPDMKSLHGREIKGIDEEELHCDGDERDIEARRKEEKNEDVDKEEMEDDEDSIMEDEDDGLSSSSLVPIVCRRQIELDTALESLGSNELKLFEEIRCVVTDSQFANIMRHLELYSSCIASRSDLLRSMQFILAKHPHLINKLSTFVRHSTTVPNDRMSLPDAHHIDYSSCRLLAVSYRALPQSFARPKCSGRTGLCYEVLNDTWVSFPSWSSEDSSSVSSKKTQYEEFVYRTEDERFELDIIIEVNAYAIGCLEHWTMQMEKMSESEMERWRLPKDTYGVSSPSILCRAIRRVYGEHSSKMLESLWKKPYTTVNVLYERLRSKESEWKEAQLSMNKIWREQSEKHMIRSLDHHSTAVKNFDAKSLRAKNLVSQIESIQEEFSNRPQEMNGPHLTLDYPHDRTIITTASQLLIHYVRRSTMSKEEKKRVKKVLRRFITELFAMPEEEMSDTEEGVTPKKKEDDECEPRIKKKKIMKPPLGEGIEDADDTKPWSRGTSVTYRLLYGGNVFYSLMRMHQLLCDRLDKLKKACHEAAIEEKLDERMRAGSCTWSDLQKGLAKLKGPRPPPPSFSRILYLVQLSLDGNVEPVALEDEMRAMLPSQGYLAFTLDKMVLAATRQLQILSSSDTDKAQTLNLYTKYRMAKPPCIYSPTRSVTQMEEEYEAEALSVMEGHNCYRMIFIDNQTPTMTIELLESEDEEEEEEMEEENEEENENGGKEKNEKKKMEKELRTKEKAEKRKEENERRMKEKEEEDEERKAHENDEEDNEQVDIVPIWTDECKDVSPSKCILQRNLREVNIGNIIHCKDIEKDGFFRTKHRPTRRLDLIRDLQVRHRHSPSWFISQKRSDWLEKDMNVNRTFHPYWGDHVAVNIYSSCS